MKTLNALVAACLVMYATAGQGQPVLEIPGSTKLQVASGPSTAGVVEFNGTTAVHGIFIAQWQASPSLDGSSERFYQLVPVPQSALQMPHFKGSPIRFINIPDGGAILARATSRSIADEFAARKLIVVHIEGIFTIQGLNIGNPCASAAIAVIADVDPIRVLYPSRPGNIGCPASP